MAAPSAKPDPFPKTTEDALPSGLDPRCKACDLAHQSKFYRALYVVAKALISSLEHQEVLHVATRSVAEATGVKGCAIRLLGLTGQLDLLAAYGLSQQYIDKGALRPELSAGVRETLLGNIAVVDVDRPEQWQYPEEARREGIAMALTVPLLVNDKAIGALCLYTVEHRSFAEPELEFLQALANLVALALDNAHRYGDVKQDYDTLLEYTFGSRH